MHKFFLLIAGCLAVLSVQASSEELDANYLRKSYYNCISDASKTNELYNQLVSLQSNKPVVIGFIGALEALKAKHAWNPYTKMDYLAKASATLAKAVAADPQNIEIRFLRYTVEYYVPSFLGYSGHVSEDKSVIVRNIIGCHYGRSDVFLVENIIKFFAEHKECSSSELALMRNAIKQCSPTY